MAKNRLIAALSRLARQALSQATTRAAPSRAKRSTARRGGGRRLERGSTAAGTARTIEVRPESVRDLRMSYSPASDGRPDAGEIVWTWVPYAEGDGRGKDRPVLVIARASVDRVYAVKLTSRSHDGDREFLPIGSGSWDARARESWVDLDQLYSVHVDGMRREAAALDRRRFGMVARILGERYGWRSAE